MHPCTLQVREEFPNGAYLEETADFICLCPGRCLGIPLDSW